MQTKALRSTYAYTVDDHGIHVGIDCEGITVPTIEETSSIFIMIMTGRPGLMSRFSRYIKDSAHTKFVGVYPIPYAKEFSIEGRSTGEKYLAVMTEGSRVEGAFAAGIHATITIEDGIPVFKVTKSLAKTLKMSGKKKAKKPLVEQQLQEVVQVAVEAPAPVVLVEPANVSPAPAAPEAPGNIVNILDGLPAEQKGEEPK